jgi:hypothetical protein
MAVLKLLACAVLLLTLCRTSNGQLYTMVGVSGRQVRIGNIISLHHFLRFQTGNTSVAEVKGYGVMLHDSQTVFWQFGIKPLPNQRWLPTGWLEIFTTGLGGNQTATTYITANSAYQATYYSATTQYYTRVGQLDWAMQNGTPIWRLNMQI